MNKNKFKNNIDNVKFFNLKTLVETDGNLVPIESNIDVPFTVERIFYVYGVRDQNDRGKHAHYETEQILVCLNGKLEVSCDDGTNKRKYLLESPQQALYIPAMIWDETVYLSKDTVMLALCNSNYDVDDYINDYKKFKSLKNEL